MSEQGRDADNHGPAPNTAREAFERRVTEFARGPRVLAAGPHGAALRVQLARAGLRVCGSDDLDMRTADFEPASFDTVVLGSLPAEPGACAYLFRRVRDWLRPGGRLVVGLFGDEQAAPLPAILRLPGLIALLSADFEIRDVATDDAGTLCVFAERPVSAPPPTLDARRLLAWYEQANDALGSWWRTTLRQSATPGEALEDERAAHRRTTARVRRLSRHVERLQAELREHQTGVRYRLGDAIVRAARPSRDTLLLPVRLVRLAVEGLRRSWFRRRQARLRKRANPPIAGPSGATSRPDWLAPFAPAPRDLIVRKDLRIAGVMDEFSWRAWQFEADLFTFTPETWQEVLESRRPHLVLIESTWSGAGDQWYFQVRDLGRRPDLVRHYAIPDIIAWCRAHDVPTVFYNKEDPPNFDVFIDAAREFDYVFTSDANCIEDYRECVGHERVYALPFAAQPRIHNPVMTEPRTGSVCFAGTWYARRHPHRQADAHAILRPALGLGLEIFDRMADADDPDYRWPEEYRPAVRGALPYAQMLSAYKRYKVFLNVNSVTDSPTMFSRRVFELLASGTPVVSSYSLGIERLLGGDLVGMSRDEATTHALLERLLGDDQYRERLALRGQRKVFCDHTYTHRLDTILDAIGLDVARLAPPRLALLAVVHRPEHVAAALDHFNRQRYAAKTLILCVAQTRAVEAARRAANRQPSVSIVHEAQASWGRLLHQAIETTRAEFFAALNPSDHYGPHYLTDYANATRYVTEPVIGKSCYYAFDGTDVRVEGTGEYCYGAVAYPWTLCLRRDKAVACARKLLSIQGAWAWWEQIMRDAGRLYSPDRFNYVRCAPPGPASENDANIAPSGRASLVSNRLDPALV